jgi:hypothetical protein
MTGTTGSVMPTEVGIHAFHERKQRHGERARHDSRTAVPKRNPVAVRSLMHWAM